jgi:hypothetical protein
VEEGEDAPSVAPLPPPTVPPKPVVKLLPPSPVELEVAVLVVDPKLVDEEEKEDSLIVVVYEALKRTVPDEEGNMDVLKLASKDLSAAVPLLKSEVVESAGAGAAVMSH